MTDGERPQLRIVDREKDPFIQEAEALFIQHGIPLQWRPVEGAADAAKYIAGYVLSCDEKDTKHLVLMTSGLLYLTYAPSYEPTAAEQPVFDKFCAAGRRSDKSRDIHYKDVLGVDPRPQHITVRNTVAPEETLRLHCENILGVVLISSTHRDAKPLFKFAYSDATGLLAMQDQDKRYASYQEACRTLALVARQLTPAEERNLPSQYFLREPFVTGLEGGPPATPLRRLPSQLVRSLLPHEPTLEPAASQEPHDESNH